MKVLWVFFGKCEFVFFGFLLLFVKSSLRNWVRLLSTIFIGLNTGTETCIHTYWIFMWMTWNIRSNKDWMGLSECTYIGQQVNGIRLRKDVLKNRELPNASSKRQSFLLCIYFLCTAQNFAVLCFCLLFFLSDVSFENYVRH